MTGSTADNLLAAALPHVPFDGWSETTFRRAARDCGLSPKAARSLCPGGGPGLALLLHRQGDRRLADWLAAQDWGDRRFRERIAAALVRRLEIAGEAKEAVRRAAALFALPHQAANGARALWQTADVTWTGLGDTTRDFSFMTKRLTLAAVWSASLLYWLGDDDPEMVRTDAFIRRRIEDVMRLDGAKARWAQSRAGQGLAGATPGWWPKFAAPGPAPEDFPGKWP